MAEDRNSPEDLYDFAQMLVRKMKKRYQLEWDVHRREDAEQTLFLWGWQVYRDTGDVGLAKHRMRTRTANLLRDYQAELDHEPKAESRQLKPTPIDGSGRCWDENAVRDREASSRYVRMGTDPAEIAAFNDYMNSLPPRRRQIVGLRLAGYEDAEIAKEVGVSLRTVEREFANLRKELKHD